MEGAGRKKRTRHYVCDVCGHQWTSYSYGERIKCPKCNEARTGKKLGRSGEAMAEVRSQRKISNQKNHHDLIMRLGRSKGVGIINCTQRPIGIHNNILSQSEHFFIFSLPHEGDRNKLAGFCGPKVLEKLPGDYYFWYYHLSMDAPILCKPLKIQK